jgi:epoxyqueuosine reductase
MSQAPSCPVSVDGSKRAGRLLFEVGRAHHAAPESLAELDDSVFAGSPIKRIGRARFVRNVLIDLGNSGDAALAPTAEKLLDDPPPLVRAMAAWALSHLLPAERFAALHARLAAGEADPQVSQEWQAARPS